MIDIQYHCIKNVKVSCSLYLKRGKKYYQEFKDLEDKIDRNRGQRGPNNHHRGNHNLNKQHQHSTQKNHSNQAKSCNDLDERYLNDPMLHQGGQHYPENSNQGRYGQRGSFLQVRTLPNRSAYSTSHSQRGSVFYNNTATADGGTSQRNNPFNGSVSSHFSMNQSGNIPNEKHDGHGNKLAPPNMEGSQPNYNLQQEGSPSTGYYLRRIPQQQQNQQNMLIPPHILASAKRNSLQNENLSGAMESRSNNTRVINGSEFRNRRSLIPTKPDTQAQSQYNYEDTVKNPQLRAKYLGGFAPNPHTRQMPGGSAGMINNVRTNSSIGSSGGQGQSFRAHGAQGSQNTLNSGRKKPGFPAPKISITQCKDADFSNPQHLINNSPKSYNSENQNQIKNMIPNLSNGLDRKQSVFRDFKPPRIGTKLETPGYNNYGGKRLSTPSTATQTFGGFLNFPAMDQSQAHSDNRRSSVTKELFSQSGAHMPDYHSPKANNPIQGGHLPIPNSEQGNNFLMPLPDLLNPGPKKRQRNSLAVGSTQNRGQLGPVGKRVSLAPPPGLEVNLEAQIDEEEIKLTVDDVRSEKGSEDGDEVYEVDKADEGSLSGRSGEGELLKECFKL